MASARAWGGLLAVLCGLSACGADSDSDRDRDRARTDQAAVKKVLDAARDALYAGDGARACRLYTSSYRREFVKKNQEDESRGASGSTCEEQVANFAPVLKRTVHDLRVIRITVSGDTATAVSEFNTTSGKAQVTEFLVRRGGQWKINGSQEPVKAAPG